MNRRLFFKNLVGAAATTAIGPTLFVQMADHEYVSPTGIPSPPPEAIFNKGGFWVFHNNRLVAWSSMNNAIISAKREILDITPDPAFNPKTIYKEYMPGPTEFKCTVEDLQIVEESNIFVGVLQINLIYNL
jgi:hypothetical protein